MNIKQILLLSLAFILIIYSCKKDPNAIDQKTVQLAQQIADLNFTESEIDSMLQSLQLAREDYTEIRKMSIENSIAPRLYFDPRPENFSIDKEQIEIDWNLPKQVEVTDNIEKVAFYSVAELSTLIKQRKISSVQLTQMYLNRLKKYGDTLECVVTLTEELALKQAKKADEELAQGIYHGPLHGIPYGVKDLFAVEAYKTTWEQHHIKIKP